jgi:regulator of protease activity HflC (stomatin/prohibitin superfamily)
VIGSVLLTAISLPPETRKMFTDVERAKIEAQSALERARGEQAALRVLANAARLITDNPALANLRLLQAIESTKGSTTIILGDAAPSSFRAPHV